MNYAICFGLFLPLLGFLIIVAASRQISRVMAGIIGCSTILLSFICFASLFFIYTQQNLNPVTVTLFSWIPVEKINADFTLHLDTLSLLMTLIITGVGFLIHVYSNGYMEEDKDYARYFAFLNFFVFSMLLLVLAGHLLVLFIGWEGVGLASYLLIGFWYDRPSAARAATKAFVINRIGDFGFLIGLLLTFYVFGTGEITEILQKVGEGFTVGAPILTLMTLLYFVGATGKSAQLPLHTWLPDAMEGPTPVSALIHAATMVTAGVYLVVRMHPLFELAPITLYVVGTVGAVTSLYAALCAVGQTDLKKVLAYSTVSQLGLMFLACGVGAFYAAMFHLTMHAFMKSLLFLSAGNVIHMMHGTQEMEKMGGLSKQFPKTTWLFLIGVLSMSGIPPLAAFFSKDLILEQTSRAGFEMLFYIGLAASILTAFYLTRAFCLTFMGASHLEDKIREFTRDAPRIMILPVTLLAFLSTVGGFIGYAFNDATPPLQSFLEKAGVSLAHKEPTGGLLSMPETWFSIGGALFAIAIAAFMYTRYAEQLKHPFPMLKKAFYLNEIYWTVIALPLKKLSLFIDKFLEPRIFDGSIRLSSRATQGAAFWLQQMQSGQIRSYVAWVVVGTVFLMVYTIFGK